MEAWVQVFVGVFGLCIGSFLNVCILRIPEGRFFADSRSTCPSCKEKIPFYLNIPIISWLMLRGKSQCCKKPISLQYPLVELGTALAFLFVYSRFEFLSFTDFGLKIDPGTFIRCVHMLVFSSLMITVSVIDMRLQIIPDVISLPMILLSPVWVAIHPQLTLFSSIMGIIIGGGCLYLIAWVYYLVRRDYGMGFGDVKLLAAIGGWLGVEAIMPTLLIGSVVGAVIGVLVIMGSKSSGLKTRLPFGPFLALGAFLHMFYGRELLSFLIVESF